jgi:signal transduction histidine kinase
LRYVAAFASLLAALLLTLSARPLFETTAYALFLAAVMFSSWYGGLTPGVIVVLLSVIALDRYFTDGFQRRSGIRTELDLPPTLSRMSRETETTVFRFVQECLTNIHCHSGSPSAHIRIQETSTGLIVEVSDRGHGMPQPNLVDMDGSSAHLGVGIMGMYERVKQAGGSMKISSGNHGTKVTAILPLEVVAVWPE